MAESKTSFFLFAQYDFKTMIPIDTVRRDFFTHLTTESLIKKIELGQIKLPLVRIEHSQKCAKGVMVFDLAKYLDDRVAAAKKELAQMTS